MIHSPLLASSSLDKVAKTDRVHKGLIGPRLNQNQAVEVSPVTSQYSLFVVDLQVLTFIVPFSFIFCDRLREQISFCVLSMGLVTFMENQIAARNAISDGAVRFASLNKGQFVHHPILKRVIEIIAFPQQNPI